MGLFSRKSKVDYDLVFREQYKSLNRIHQQARDELDYKVKESLMEVVVEKYRELLELIDKGANQDSKHFEALKKKVPACTFRYFTSEAAEPVIQKIRSAAEVRHY